MLMMIKNLRYVAASVFILSLPTDLAAHGSTYRGPGNTVPPGTGQAPDKGGDSGGSDPADP